ncbi:TRAP transporter large permease [Microbacterium sp. CPCC 204701]|uniref:TRAP transporter large permease n=1 Tax=Microbacterium sp. CPCC 204701 TaxID=2493084 RepID=UPI000FD6DEC6|nr:TRAP transporter large permease subunit [Microbacterium sp. CPCC 204701]
MSAVDQREELSADVSPQKLRRAAVWYVYATPIVVGMLLVLMFTVESGIVVGALAFVLLLWLMFLRIPVGLTLGIVGVLGIFILAGGNAASSMLRGSAWTSSASWTLSVIPMFIFMGMIMERSGLGSTVFGAVRALVGRTPAGLAVSTNFAGAAMGAASGSTLGIVYALGRTGIPEMVKAGYDRRFAAGAVLMAGTGGQLIPPSILLVIYAGIAQVPVGQQLMAGVVPGVLIHVAFAFMMVVMVLVRPSLAPRRDGEKLPIGRRLGAIVGLWPVIVLIAVVLGGLYAGVFTPTEAGAFGALAALVMVGLTKGLKVLGRAVLPAVRDTVIATGGIFLIIIGGDMFGRFMTVTGIPRAFTTWLEDVGAGPVVFMIFVLVLYLLLGTFMDPVPMMLVTVPILLPVAMSVGVNPLIFGVFVVLLGELAVLTPPVGVLVFVVHRIAREAKVPMTLSEVNQGAAWFYPVTILFALLLILFPDLFLWLPEAMNQTAP